MLTGSKTISVGFKTHKNVFKRVWVLSSSNTPTWIFPVKDSYTTTPNYWFVNYLKGNSSNNKKFKQFPSKNGSFLSWVFLQNQHIFLLYLMTKRCFGSEFCSSNAKLIVLFEMICTISRSITLFFSYFLDTCSTTTTLYPTLTNCAANFPIDFSGNPQCSCLFVKVKSSTF